MMRFIKSMGELRFVKLFKDRGKNLLSIQGIVMRLTPCVVD